METKRYIERQAAVIDQVLETFGVHGRVTSGRVSPRWIAYYAPGGSLAGVNAADVGAALARALDVPAGGVRVREYDGTLCVEVDHEPWPLTALAVMRMGGGEPVPCYTAILGVCDDGAPLSARLPSEECAPLLVVGEGRELLRAIVFSLLCLHPESSELALVLVGDLGDDLAATPPASGYGWPAGEVLSGLVRILEQRQRQALRQPPAVVVVIAPDEFERMAQTKAVARLLREGRAAGMYVVAGARRGYSGLPFALRLEALPGRSGYWSVYPHGYRFEPATLGDEEASVLAAMGTRSFHEAGDKREALGRAAFVQQVARSFDDLCREIDRQAAAAGR